MTATEIKNILLFYWRITRHYCCCTELKIKNHNILDIAAYDFKDNFVDCEIKTSKYDLLADSKKSKHHIYTNQHTNKKYQSFFPNKFIYAVPEFLADDAIKQCETINSKYGVVVVHSKYYVEVRKSAKKLYSGINKENTHKIITNRLNCEVMTLREKLYNLSSVSEAM